jgi:hypothetical protein
MRASGPASSVVTDQRVAVGQWRLREEWEETVGKDVADKEYGLAGSDHLVLQSCAVDLYALHGSLLVRSLFVNRYA